MKRLGICLILLACVSTGHSEPGQSPLFVSTEWLAQHLNETGVTVLQVGFSRPEFQLGHIPGARFLWFDWLAISTPDLSTEMPPLTHADSVLEMLGITGNGGGVARTGHIKGAISIPFGSCVDSMGRAKDAAALQKLFDDAGVKKGMRVVTYCHVGQQATLVYAIARSLGYDAAVYDGSFQEWNVRGDAYPVEKPSAADR